MPKILVVGGGYAGFYTAWKLEKHLRQGEAEVVMVDPLPYMTYQPFLPEVAAGSIEPRHAVVAHRRHLKKTRVVTAKVTKVDHATKTATITPTEGEAWEESYDQIVMTAGAVSRTFPIPGVADEAIGLKTIEEAASIRDQHPHATSTRRRTCRPVPSATACSPSSSSVVASPASRCSPSSAPSSPTC